MADVTLTSGAYRALLVPDQRFTYASLDLASSTVTQDGARAGVPQAARPTRGILEASGEQDPEDVTITVTRGGFVRDSGGAAFTWSSTGVLGEIGWEAPTAISDVAPVVVSTPTYARGLASSPAVVGLPDGRLVTAFNRQSSAALDQTSTRTRLGSGSWLTIKDIGLVSDIVSSYENRMALLWDDARQIVRLYVLWRDVTVSGSERGRLSLYTSSNGGVSWTQTQEDCLSEPLDWSATGNYVHGISIAMSGDSLVSLLISVTSLNVTLPLFSTVVQYASGDGGFTFDLVEIYEPLTANDSLGGVSYTVFPDPGRSLGFKVVWSSASNSDIGTIYQADLGSPFTSWGAVAGEALVDFAGSLGTISGDVLSPTPIGLAQDPAGSVWIYVPINTAFVQKIVAIHLTSNGASLVESPSGTSYPGVISTSDIGESIVGMAACFHQGGVAILSGLSTSSASTYTGLMMLLTLGGYSSATRRPVSFGNSPASLSAPYEVDWIGTAGFGSFFSWSVSAVGSPSVTADTSLGVEIDASGGFTDSYQATYNPIVSGGSQGQGQIICEVAADNINWFLKSDGVIHLRLRISATQIVVRDMVALSDLETIILPASGPHIIRASFHRGLSTTVYWRVEVTPWTTGATVRTWDSYDGTLSASASAGDRCRVTVAYPAVATLYHVGYVAGEDGTGLSDDTLTPRPFSSTPSPVYHGVSVALQSGPVMAGDSWTINPAYDYGIHRIYQEIDPSPRSKFVATAASNASTVSLVHYLGDGGAAVRLGAPVIGVGIFGANFRTATVNTSSSPSGPWTKIADIDMSCGLNALSWERVGYTVTAPVTSPSTGPFYIAENSLAGSSFIYKSGEAFTILRNTGGLWQQGANVKRARLVLSGASVDASGSTGAIVHKDAICLIYGLQDVQYLKIEIPAQTTPSGVIELGNLMFGRVEILGRQYGRGRSIEHQSSVDIFTASNGARRSRILAPNRKLVTVSWQDNAIDTTSVWTNPGSADYVRAETGLPPASYVAATSDQVKGIVEQIEGNPLGYISKLTPDSPTMIAPSSILRGRVLSPVVVDTVLGDEEDSELVRVAALTIEEEV